MGTSRATVCVPHPEHPGRDHREAVRVDDDQLEVVDVPPDRAACLDAEHVARRGVEVQHRAADGLEHEAVAARGLDRLVPAVHPLRLDAIRGGSPRGTAQPHRHRGGGGHADQSSRRDHQVDQGRTLDQREEPVHWSPSSWSK